MPKRASPPPFPRERGTCGSLAARRVFYLSNCELPVHPAFFAVTFPLSPNRRQGRSGDSGNLLKQTGHLGLRTPTHPRTRSRRKERDFKTSGLLSFLFGEAGAPSGGSRFQGLSSERRAKQLVQPEANPTLSSSRQNVSCSFPTSPGSQAPCRKFYQ